MPYYKDRNSGREIWLASGENDAIISTAILIVIAPFALVFAVVFIIADFITAHFMVTSVIYFSVTALISLIIAKITERKTVNRILDCLGLMLMFFAFSYFSFFYYIPRVINQGGLMDIIGWIFVSFVFGSLFVILYNLKKIVRKPALWFISRLIVASGFTVYYILN